MRKIHFALLFCMLPYIAYTAPQKNEEYQPGYYISLSGDTIHGAIAFLDVKQRSKYCRFKQQGKDSLSIYSPNDIRGYRYTDGRLYVSKKVSRINGEESVFIECLVEGYLCAFLLTDTSGNHFYLGRSNEPLLEVPYKDGVKHIVSQKSNVQGEKDGWYHYQTREHIPILAKQLNDVPQIANRIKRTKILNRHIFVDLVKDYNNMRCDSVRCIVYKTNEPSMRVALEPVVGMTYFWEPQKTVVQGGLAGVFSFPNDNVTLQVKTGLLVSQYDDSGTAKMFYTIPFQLQYPFIFQKTVVRLYWGENIIIDGPHWGDFFELGWTSSIGGDFVYRINKKASVLAGVGITMSPLMFSLGGLCEFYSLASQIGFSYQF
jgi:hypothetical protein